MILCPSVALAKEDHGGLHPSFRERRDPKPFFNKKYMYYVYLLTDVKGKIYIGFSANLKKRLSEHKQGNVYWTRRLLSPRLMYYEAYEDINSAKVREKKLKKRGSSYQGLIKRIKNPNKGS